MNSNEQNINWDEVRQSFHAKLSRKLYAANRHYLDDAVQMCLERYLLVARRAVIKSPGGLQERIAGAVLVDILRKNSSTMDSIEDFELADTAPSPAQTVVPSLHQVLLVIQEYLKDRKPHCFEYYRLRITRRWDHQRIAQAMNEQHQNVRQAWRRCILFLRDAVNNDPTLAPLREWGLDLLEGGES